MSMVAMLLTSSLVTVLAVIGLADALTHLLARLIRSRKSQPAVGSTGPMVHATHRSRLAA